MKPQTLPSTKSSGAGDALMILLALVSVGLLFFEVLAEHSPAQTRSLELADLSIAFVFLSEFSIRLYRAPQRALFLRKHWWELLASIPFTSETTQVLRAFNLLRLFRLMKLLRLIRFAVRFKILLENSARFAQQTYLLYLCTSLGLVIMAGALGFHYMESEVNPNVHGLWEVYGGRL